MDIRASTLAGTSLWLALATSGGAYAQTTPTDVGEAPMPSAAAEQSEQDIVVTGIRGGIEQAVRIKRNAPSIVDVISADDIGRYPDVNVAESVQRISGVQINRTRGEGRSVNIRGLPDTFTLVTLNGRAVPNAINDLFTGFSRSFDFSTLPPEFVRTLEVYKSPTPNLEDGGLSGTVNIRTPRALDLGRRIVTVTTQAEYESNSGKAAPRVSALFADRFLDNRLGITIGASYTQRRPQTHQIETGWNTVTEGQGVPVGGGADDLNGDGRIDPTRLVRIPGVVIQDMFTEDNRRLSGIASLQFRPDDRFEVYVDGLYTRVDVDAVRQENFHNFAGSGGVVASRSEVLDGVDTATDFTVSNLDLRDGGRYQDRSGYIRSLVGGFKLDDGGWHVLVEGSAQKSRQTRSTLNIADSINGTARIVARPGDVVPSITYLSDLDTRRLNPNSFRLLSLNGELDRVTSDRLRDLKIDVRRDLDEHGLTALLLGAKATDRTIYADNKVLTIAAAGVSRLYGGLPAGPLPGSFSAAPFMIPIAPGSGEFLGSYDGDATFPTGDEPQPGFDHWVSFKGQGSYLPSADGLNVDGRRVPQKGYITDELTDYAIDWINKRDTKRPWMMHLAHKAVHSEFIPAERHKGRYANETFRYPENMRKGVPGRPMWVENQRNSWHGVDYAYHGNLDIADYYKRYMETLLAVDEGISRILDLLEQRGELDDTLILYMGDNGFMFGEHGLIDKRAAYEESMRVPMLARCPSLFAPGMARTRRSTIAGSGGAKGVFSCA